MGLVEIIGWVVWGIALTLGTFFAWGIRQSATQKLFPPSWTTLITCFYLEALPIIFLFINVSKLHIIWIVVLIWIISVKLCNSHIPIVSEVLIWPAYIYGRILTAGTGTSLTSPTKGCGDTSIITSKHLKSLPVTENRLIAEFLSSLPDVRFDISEDVLSDCNSDVNICKEFNSIDELIKNQVNEKNNILHQMFIERNEPSCWQRHGPILVLSRYNKQDQLMGIPMSLECIARTEKSKWKKYNLTKLFGCIDEEDILKS